MLPIRWFVAYDSTGRQNEAGTHHGHHRRAATGPLTVGSKPATSRSRRIDADGAEAVADVTVGSPTTTAPWVADAGTDSGAGLGRDTGTYDAGHDAGP